MTHNKCAIFYWQLVLKKVVFLFLHVGNILGGGGGGDSCAISL